MLLNAAGSMLSFLFSGNGTSETATSLIKSRLMSISRLDIEVGVDLASAFLFLATLDPAPEYELPADTLTLLAVLLAPVSITEVGPEDEPIVFDMLAVDIVVEPALEVLILLVLVVVLLLPNTESELTTIVSVKLDVVNLAMASFDRRSLLLPVWS